MPAIRLLDRILSTVGWPAPAHEAPPLLSSTAAALLSIFLTLLYVAPFYCFAHTRPSVTLSRDAPIVVKARIRIVSCACLLGSLVTAAIAWHGRRHSSLPHITHLLGYWPLQVLDIVKSGALVAILFVGPIFEATVVQGRWRDCLSPSLLLAPFRSWLGWRNYVAGPVTEEILFRSVIIPIHLFAHVSPVKLVFVTPLYFGVAHAHHFYEFRVQHPEYPLSVGLLRTLLQLAYTSLFGFFASFLFLRTANLPAVVLAHSFCNLMGLPRFWGRLEVSIDEASDVARQQYLETGQAPQSRLHITWSVAYYLLLVVGVYGFSTNLWTLTESVNALVRF